MFSLRSLVAAARFNLQSLPIVHDDVYHTPLVPIFRARYHHSWNIVFRCRKGRRWNIYHRELSECVSFGIGTLLVVEQFGLRKRSRRGGDVHRRKTVSHRAKILFFFSLLLDFLGRCSGDDQARDFRGKTPADVIGEQVEGSEGADSTEELHRIIKRTLAGGMDLAQDAVLAADEVCVRVLYVRVYVLHVRVYVLYVRMCVRV